MSNPNIYRFLADRSNNDSEFNKIREHCAPNNLFDIANVSKSFGYSRRKTRRIVNRFIRKNLVELAYEHN